MALGGRAGGGAAAVTPGGGSFSGLTGVSAPLTGVGTGGSPLAIPAATAGNAGHMTAAQASALAAAATAASVSAVEADVTALENSRHLLSALIGEALVGMGLSANPERLLFFFQDFANKGEQGLFADVSGTTSGSAAGNQAWLLQANASGIRNVVAGAGVGNASARPFLAGSGKRFYMAARMAPFDTPANAGESFGMGLKTSGSGAGAVPATILGYSRSVSTGFYVYVGNVNLISTVAPVAGTFATVRCWRDGSTTSLQVDSETPVTHATARHSGESFLIPGFVVASASAQFRAQIKWAFFATELE